jgi:hypothetical protein
MQRKAPKDLLKGFPAIYVVELKTHIAKMTIATGAQKELIETLEMLRGRFNAYSEQDRLHNPEAWAVQDEWVQTQKTLHVAKKQIIFLTGRFLKLTGYDIELWPRHLKYQHPNGLDISAYDIPATAPEKKEHSSVGFCCCVCLENFPNATFTTCCDCTGVCCTVCADSLIRRQLNCPQCGDMVFDYYY